MAWSDFFLSLIPVNPLPTYLLNYLLSTCLAINKLTFMAPIEILNNAPSSD